MRNSQKICIAVFCVLGGFLIFAPSRAQAALSLPTTPCDEIFSTGIIDGVAIHLTPESTLEDGATAFMYGADNNNFVSSISTALTFNVKVLFAPGSYFGTIKLNGLDAACHLTSAFGAAFPADAIIPFGENILTYNPETNEVNLNGVSNFQKSAIPRYLWVEVWDGVKGSDMASFSYLIDITDPRNPTGQVDEPDQLDPVIIIPGILGTELFYQNELVWPNISKMISSFGDEFLDVLIMDELGNSLHPVTVGEVTRLIEILGKQFSDHTQGLIDEFKSVGYIEESNLVTFPYDWRKDIRGISQDLYEFINLRFPTQRVNIVAHSMGGLVTKRYILDYGGDRINKLIFVGTPHLGSSKATRTLLFGDTISVLRLPIVDFAELKKISRNMASLYELLPNKLYFSNLGAYLKVRGDLLDYSQTKNFLADESLNALHIEESENFYKSGINNMNFSNIETFNINGCDIPTLNQFNIGNTPSGSKLLIFPKFLPGDGTVPLWE